MKGSEKGMKGDYLSTADGGYRVLVDAIDTFEEYDPDWMDKGGHERVTASLRAFGASAAKLAVPVLVRHFRDSVGDVDRDVVHLLGELGPAAEEALPALREFDKDLRSLDPESPWVSLIANCLRG